MSRFNPETGDLVLECINQQTGKTFLKDYRDLCFGSSSNSYEYEEEDGWVLTIGFESDHIVGLSMSKGTKCIDLGIDLKTIQFVK